MLKSPWRFGDFWAGFVACGKSTMEYNMGNTRAMHSQMQVSEITGVSVSFTTANTLYCHYLPILIIDESKSIKMPDRFLAILTFGDPSNLNLALPTAHSPSSRLCHLFLRTTLTPLTHWASQTLRVAPALVGKRCQKWKTLVFRQDLKVEGRVLSLCGCCK